jgi:signal transduction histidine kinase
MVVIVAGGLLAFVGVSYLLGLVAAFVACIRWPRRTPLIATVTIGTIALFVLREALTPWGRALPWYFELDPVADEAQWVVARVILAVLSIGVLAALVVVRGTREEASRSKLQAQAQHERADALDAALARQTERERIARDLHDGLGHRLSTLALAAGAFEAQVADTPVEPHLAEWARHVRGQAHLALEDMRGFVGALRSDASDKTVSLRQLGALVEGVRSAGHRADLTVILEGLEGVSPACDSAAYRIVQEALTNAIKHAPGEPVTVTATAAPGAGIRIRVANPLASDPAVVSGGGQGIIGIRERVAAVGGEVWIGTHQGSFLVDATLPWA